MGIMKVRRGAQGELAKRFGCSESAVSTALRDNTDSELAKAIRLAAKEPQYAYVPPRSTARILRQKGDPIRLVRGGAKTLADKFCCTKESIHLACTYKTDSPMSREIRKAAVELNLVRDTDAAKLPRVARQPLCMDFYPGAVGDIAAACGVTPTHT